MFMFSGFFSFSNALFPSSASHPDGPQIYFSGEWSKRLWWVVVVCKPFLALFLDQTQQTPIHNWMLTKWSIDARKLNCWDHLLPMTLNRVKILISSVRTNLYTKLSYRRRVNQHLANSTNLISTISIGHGSQKIGKEGQILVYWTDHYMPTESQEIY